MLSRIVVQTNGGVNYEHPGTSETEYSVLIKKLELIKVLNTSFEALKSSLEAIQADFSDRVLENSVDITMNAAINFKSQKTHLKLQEITTLVLYRHLWQSFTVVADEFHGNSKDLIEKNANFWGCTFYYCTAGK